MIYHYYDSDGMCYIEILVIYIRTICFCAIISQCRIWAYDLL